jgi:hypothetical protein
MAGKSLYSLLQPPDLKLCIPPNPSINATKTIPMKQLLTLLFLAILCTCGPAQVQAQEVSKDEKNVSSKITNATVFLDGAQVSRSAKTTIPTGRGILVFSGLTKDMDPASIQVKSDNDDFIVLSVSHRLNFNKLPDENPAADKIYRQMDALDARKALLTVNYRITQEEEAILKLNRVVASPQTGLDANDLIAAVNFHRERITSIKRTQLSISDSLATIKDDRKLLQAQLSDIGIKRQTKATAEIVVVTQATRAVTDDFTVSYMVPNARWIPHYDVRVTNISQPVDLRYRAKVSQQSGEDWTNIRLKLSTADPTASGVAPTLTTWRLHNNSRPPTYSPMAKKTIQTGVRSVTGRIIEPSGEGLIGATIVVPGTAIGAVTDIDGYYSIEVPSGSAQLLVSYLGYTNQQVNIQSGPTNAVMRESGMELDEVVVTGYGNRNAADLAGSVSGVQVQRDRKRRRKDSAPVAAPVPVNIQRLTTSVNFDIELPYSIPSDGKARDVEIKQHKLSANYTHLAVPKLSPNTYLKAAVTDWEQYDLLSGQVNLFFEGTYLGNSVLDVSTTNDTLELSLGRDPNVIVTRKATEDYRNRNFFGGKVSDSRGYTINVRNKKKQPINLVIMDQVPISADETITVKVDRDAYFRLNETTGILTWKQKLEAGGSRETRFGYTVKYSKGVNVILE